MLITSCGSQWLKPAAIVIQKVKLDTYSDPWWQIHSDLFRNMTYLSFFLFSAHRKSRSFPRGLQTSVMKATTPSIFSISSNTPENSQPRFCRMLMETGIKWLGSIIGPDPWWTEAESMSTTCTKTLCPFKTVSKKVQPLLINFTYL